MPQLPDMANLSVGNSVGTPAKAKAIATPAFALLVRLLRSASWPLMLAMSAEVAKPRLAALPVARLPVASEVTICTGPDCAALLAAEAMPAMVKVLVAVPNICWFALVAVAPLPNAAELAKVANAPFPIADEFVPVAVEPEPTAVPVPLALVKAPIAVPKLPPPVTLAPEPIAMALLPPPVTLAPEPIAMALLPPPVVVAPEPIAMALLPPPVAVAPEPIAMALLRPPVAVAPEPIAMLRLP